MTRLELMAKQWHDRAYGKHVNLPATYSKLLEEVGELGEALMIEDSSAVLEEAGDVGFVLMHIVRAAGKGNPSLAAAMAGALQKNLGRLEEK